MSPQSGSDSLVVRGVFDASALLIAANVFIFRVGYRSCLRAEFRFKGNDVNSQTGAESLVYFNEFPPTIKLEPHGILNVDLYTVKQVLNGSRTERMHLLRLMAQSSVPVR